MAPEHHETIGTITSRFVALFAGWLGSIALADIQAWMSIASAATIIAYTVMQMLSLRRREREAAAEKEAHEAH